MRYEVQVISPGNVVKVRNYDVRKCMENKESMEIEFEGSIMTLTHKELVSKLKGMSGTYLSEFKGGQPYKLMFYTWNPDNEGI